MITTRISITSNSDDDTASLLRQMIILLEQTDVEHADGADQEGQSFSFDIKRTQDQLQDRVIIPMPDMASPAMEREREP